MPNSLLRAAARVKFEAPLAILLGLATLFAAIAGPPPLAATGLFARVAIGLLGGIVTAAIGYAAMRFPYQDVLGGTAAYEPPVGEEEEVSGLAAADISVRLRRADRHPDAPAREPIRATRDLGSPFMEVGAFAPAPRTEFVPTPPIDPVPVEMVPIEMAPVEMAPVDLAPVDLAPDEEPLLLDRVDPDFSREPLPFAAFTPAEEPVPATARPSLAAMMDRLSAGLAARAADDRPDTAPDGRGEIARALQPQLREALDELNRLATRRG